MISLVVLFLIIYASDAQQLSSIINDYDVKGVRLASNDHTTVLAQNDFSSYLIVFSPFTPDNYCYPAYSSTQNVVMSVAIGRKQTAEQQFFVYLRATEDEPRLRQLGVFRFNKTECLQEENSTEVTNGDVWKFFGAVNDLIVLKVDPPGEFAYGFWYNHSFIFDVSSGHVTEILWTEPLFDVPVPVPKDAEIAVTDDGIRVAIVVGYYSVDADLRLPAVYLIRLEPPFSMSSVDSLPLVNDTFADGSFADYYSFDYVMSVSIEDTTQQILVGLPYFGRTVLLKFNSTKLTLIRTFSYAARSVTWIDAGTQAALLLNAVPTPPWISSQIHVINTSVTDMKTPTLFAIPNNQQTIALKSVKESTSLIRVAASGGQPIALTNTGVLLYVPVAPINHYSALTGIIALPSSPMLCPPGTFKLNPGPSPCIVCPTGYKRQSEGNFSSTTECVPCSPGSFCPLASVNDVNISAYPSANQGYPYPNSPSSTNFDDIIITNTFQISSDNRRCLRISPIFWTLIVFALAGMILIVMGILYWMPNRRRHFTWLTTVFRRADLIGEGELWVGGLMSFALLVLIAFGFWFGFVYAKQYPIETVGDAYFACDTSLRNAKFSSSLQLLALLKTEEETPMFELLKQQNWTLTLDLIQTGFKCKDISAQGNIESYKITLPISKCFQQPDNATLTLVVPLSTHLITVQFNLTGNSYVGASRICIHGPSTTRNKSHSTVKELAFCLLLSTADQTMAQVNNVKLDFTKVINRTEGLQDDDPVTYSGIWIPTVTTKSLNDRVAYGQQGTYLRYLSAQQIFSFELTETQFFIKNNQEPIARSGEIIFHNILFSTVCIELFGLAFLLFKLALMPLLKLIVFKLKDGCCLTCPSKTKRHVSLV